MVKNIFEFCHGILLEQRPAVAGAEKGTVAKLDHAGVLRASERIRVNEFGRLGPGFAFIARSHQHEITVRVGMSSAVFAKYAAFGRAAKSDYQLSVRAADNRRKSAVKLGILADDQVLQFVNA